MLIQGIQRGSTERFKRDRFEIQEFESLSLRKGGGRNGGISVSAHLAMHLSHPHKSYTIPGKPSNSM